MQLRVLLFARAAELAGHDHLMVSCSDAQTTHTAGDVLSSLADACPALNAILPTCRLAINNEFVAGDAMVAPQDEIALIPPVSGG